MNVEIGADAAQFPENEYINGIAVAVYNKLRHAAENSMLNAKTTRLKGYIVYAQTVHAYFSRSYSMQPGRKFKLPSTPSSPRVAGIEACL
jgi:hypothetical protein